VGDAAQLTLVHVGIPILSRWNSIGKSVPENLFDIEVEPC